MEVSTLLLIAVAVAVSVAAVLWVVNIAFFYTGFEMLAVACRAGNERVFVSLRNRGTGPVRIVAVVWEGKVEELNLTLKPGEIRELELPVARTGAVQVEVRTPGKVYRCLVEVRG